MSDPFVAPPDFPARSTFSRECSECGACCAAPDIAALRKPLGVPCPSLTTQCRCAVYASRPDACRNYRPDWVCGEVAPLPSLEARIQRYLEVYGLTLNDTIPLADPH